MVTVYTPTSPVVGGVYSELGYVGVAVTAGKFLNDVELGVVAGVAGEGTVKAVVVGAEDTC